MASRRRELRGRLALVLLTAGATAAAVVLLMRSGDEPDRLVPGAAPGDGRFDPLAYDSARRADFERRAAAGLAHVLYAKSPGGAVATAARTARWRPLVDRAAAAGGVDPGTLEAIVFLESAGRDDARASDDLDGAAGLTQILAETAVNLLGLKVDVRASQRLTRGIARGRKVRARRAVRRRVDERFDPEKALAATVRYLGIAKRALRRDDLAVVSYHMGIGNLQQALAAYGEEGIPYAQLYFGSSPLRKAPAWAKLASLGDDSSTYLWRVLAAKEIMRLSRSDPGALERTAQHQGNKNSAEEVLQPPGSTPVFGDPAALGRATAAGEIAALDATLLRAHGLRIDTRMGELAPRLRRRRALYRGLRPEALALLVYLGTGTRAIARVDPLTVTSTVRDRRYQRLLVGRTVEATRNYSLHTTGWAFDISRRYVSRAQARAFQFMLDRLTALDMIAWVREPGAIHVTVGPRARALVPLLGRAPPP
jgi:soluble lytic murein transglycosylase-like protein